jgi:acyl-CoA reductase-like NAD-dependent aldehyde dehydrogenase
MIGKQLIGFEESAAGTATISSVNPATGEKIAEFAVATETEVNQAVAKAATAYHLLC